MSVLSDAMGEHLKHSSMIRRMFEAGIVLKRQYGEDAVCDFSLGNPDLPPPPAVADALRKLADTVSEPFSLGYMPNGGYPWAREILAGHLAKEQQCAVTVNQVILSCGAAGAVNALLRAVINPGDEVLAVTPCFVEYGFYVENHGGILRTVPSKPETFALDVDAIAGAIGPKTRAIIVNTPNNPTGVVYSEAEMKALCAVLDDASRKHGRPVYLISDEPYRFLAFDGTVVPPVLPLYRYAVVVGSFSKNLSLAGERLGYLAFSPLLDKDEQKTLLAAVIMTNRILGYVNPPVIGQHLMAAAIDTPVDAGIYKERRDVMARVLADAGYEFQLPRGAFYFFPKAPGGDDAGIVARLVEERILGVPGSGFMGPGYFRLTFCVDSAVIERAAEGFKKALHG